MNLDFNVLVFLTGFIFSLPIIGYVFRFHIPISIFFLLAGTFMVAILLSTDGIIFDNVIGEIEAEEPNYAYRVTTGSTASGFLDASSIGKGERLTVNSTMIGKKIQCIGVELSKAGSPTGFAEIGIFSELNSNSLYYKFGQIDVSTLTAVNIFHDFCVEEGFEHILVARDIIGIKYNGATAINHPDLRRTTTDVFDSTNTQAVTVATAGASWTTIATSDFNMVAYDIQTIDNSVMDFTFTGENFQLKVIMIFVSVMFMVGGALVEVKQR